MSQLTCPRLYDWQTQVDQTDKDGWVSGQVNYTVTGSFQEVANGTNPFTVQIPTDCVDPVVLLHWGGGGGPKDTVLVEGLAAGSSYEFKYTYTKTPPGSLFKPGISGYGVYCGPPTTVPDGGATAALMGLGLLGLGWVQRRC